MTEKNILNVIDGTLRSVEDNFKTFIEVLETAKNELILLENEKAQLSHDKQLLENEKLQLEEATKMLETEKEELEQAKNKLEKETKEKEEKIGTMTEEQKRLLKEYEKVKVELSKFAKLAEEAESQELNFEKIQALLSIFRVLVEKIWQGQPHYRVLKVLHGEKESMTREELKNTTGIGGAYVLRAVQELANVNLVEHDIDTATVTLKQRLYAKEALDKKT
jgi:chromosome segregation ATPase